MSYENTRLIKEDVLFRGGEPKIGSQYNDEVISYLNRVYFGICSGASEFVPEFVDDWWWMRDKSSLILEPIIALGSVFVTQGDVAVTFANAPVNSVVGWQFKVDGHPDKFFIATHTAGQQAATLDYAWTGPTVTHAQYRLGKVRYTLDAAVQALIAPMTSYRSPPQVMGMSPEAMDARWPPGELLDGAPQAFALEDERTVRFSHAGRTDGTSMRVDYIYRPVVSALTDDTSSIPLVPAQFRHVLADGALSYLREVKNDSTAPSAAAATRQVLAAMIKENRRRFVKLDKTLFHIFPRMAGLRIRSPSDMALE